MKNSLLLLFLFFTSCLSPYGRIGVGGLVGRHVMDCYAGARNGVEADTTNIEIGIFQPINVFDNLYTDWGIEAVFYYVGSEDSIGASLDANLRLRYDAGIIEPYIYAQHGFGTWQPKFDRQGSSWGFPTSFGAGIRLDVYSDIWLFLEYRAFHESNGAGTFLESPSPNPGYNSDMIFGGLEFSF